MSKVIHDNTPPAGPLTTIFTPSSNCFATPTLLKSSVCMPQNWEGYYGGDISYYSPGICPSGYTSAGEPNGGYGPRIEASETAIVCCPSNFVLSKSGTYHSCSYTSVPTTTITTEDYDYVTITSSSTTTTSRSYFSTTITTTTSLKVYAIQVRWAESDIPNLETNPVTGETNKPKPPSGDPPPTETDAPGGLGTGAKVGIGVGVALGAIILLLVGLALFLRKRRQTRRAQHPQHAPGYASHGGLMPGAAGDMASTYEKTGSPQPPLANPAGSTSPGGSIPQMYGGGGYAQPGMQHLDGSGQWSSHGGEGPLAGDEAELQRIQERRSRLMELERLAEEESRVRARMQEGRAELPVGQPS